MDRSATSRRSSRADARSRSRGRLQHNEALPQRGRCMPRRQTKPTAQIPVTGQDGHKLTFSEHRLPRDHVPGQHLARADRCKSRSALRWQAAEYDQSRCSTPERHLGKFLGMTSMRPLPHLGHVDDEEFERLAKTWRAQALRGDREANGIAHALEVERRRRLRGSQMAQLSPDPEPARPWWKFWKVAPTTSSEPTGPV